jgi:bifunctional ADP-heptose synthase (sugar kinase/adenylyltransferase)
VVPERQRAELLAGFECVDHVVFFGEDTPVPLIRALKPDIVCKGGEYREPYVPEKETIESLGGRFVLLRQVPGVRSSSLIKRSRR